MASSVRWPVSRSRSIANGIASRDEITRRSAAGRVPAERLDEPYGRPTPPGSRSKPSRTIGDRRWHRSALRGRGEAAGWPASRAYSCSPGPAGRADRLHRPERSNPCVATTASRSRPERPTARRRRLEGDPARTGGSPPKRRGDASCRPRRRQRPWSASVRRSSASWKCRPGPRTTWAGPARRLAGHFILVGVGRYSSVAAAPVPTELGRAPRPAPRPAGPLRGTPASTPRRCRGRPRRRRPRSGPGRSSLKRIFSDSASSISRWIVRRSGRAPMTGSQPFLASHIFAVVGQLETHVLVAELGLDPDDHHVHDPADLLVGELVEDDGVVDAVQELRAEVLLQLVVDLLLHPVVVRLVIVRRREAEADRLRHVPRAEVGGQDDHRVLEVHDASLTVGQATVLEDLRAAC